MIEAARAMGASNIRIIVKVLLVEARTSLITGATIAIGTILGYSAMSGAVGAVSYTHLDVYKRQVLYAIIKPE